MKARGLAWHALAVFGFLYLPIVTLIVYSFNGAGVGGFPPRNLTLPLFARLTARSGPQEAGKPAGALRS